MSGEGANVVLATVTSVGESTLGVVSPDHFAGEMRVARPHGTDGIWQPGDSVRLVLSVVSIPAGLVGR